MRGAKLEYQWHSKKDWCPPKIKKRRMHSSRIGTARLLTVSQHALPGGVPARGCTCLGVYLPRRCTCLEGTYQGVYLPMGVCTFPGGCTCPGVCVYLPGGCTCPGTPPPVNRMTDRCKNITLPQTSFAGGNKPRISTNKKM